MDDLAEKLSASKKTLYQYFKDKKELVNIVTSSYIEDEKERMDSIHVNCNDAVDEMLKISERLRDMPAIINPSCIFDIKKYYPKVWKGFQDFKIEYIKKTVTENLNNGIKEGLYRDNFNTEILACLKIAEIEIGIDQDQFPMDKFNPFDVQLQLFDHFLAGILTEKGSQLLNNYKNK